MTCKLGPLRGHQFTLAWLISVCVSVGSHVQAQVANHFTPNEIATAACWIDAQTGQRYPTVEIPAGSQVAGNFSGEGPPVVPGDVTVGADGVHAFNKKTGQNLVRQSDGSWIDAQSGQPYPTLSIPAGSQVVGNFSGEGPPVVPGDVTIGEDGVHAFNRRAGQNLVRVPCPQPETASTTPPIGAGSPPPGASRPVNRTPTSSDPHPYSWNVGVDGGALRTTSTFDDGFRVRGTLPVLQVWAQPPAIRLGRNVSLVFPFEVAFPIGNTDREFARAALPVVGSVGPQVQFTVEGLGGRPLLVFVRPSLDIGALQAGSTFPADRFTDTRAVVGWGLDSGARAPIAPGLMGEVRVSYLSFPFHTFHGPTGDFGMKQEAAGVTIGLSKPF